jgi:hypothetical protein
MLPLEGLLRVEDVRALFHPALKTVRVSIAREAIEKVEVRRAISRAVEAQVIFPV